MRYILLIKPLLVIFLYNRSIIIVKVYNMIDEKVDIDISSMQDQIKELQNLLTTATNENKTLINILKKMESS